MISWVQQNDVLLWWAVAGSAVAFLGTLVAVPWLIVAIPEDYFLPKRRRRSAPPRHPVVRVLFHVAKNAAGAVFVALGFVMLFTPGQGVLSILTGLILLDFPGKRALEGWLIRRHGALRAVNAIRRRAGRPPLRLDDHGAPGVRDASGRAPPRDGA